jgi:hypothetical protein
VLLAELLVSLVAHQVSIRVPHSGQCFTPTAIR